jgi:hypothetical protein
MLVTCHKYEKLVIGDVCMYLEHNISGFVKVNVRSDSV